jgi:hypothetical protein
MHTREYLTSADLDMLERVLNAFAPDASIADRGAYALLLIRWFQDGEVDEQNLLAYLEKFAGRDTARASE